MPTTRPKTSLVAKVFRDTWLRGLGIVSGAEVEELDRLYERTWFDEKHDSDRTLVLLEHMLATITPAWLEKVGMYGTAMGLRSIAKPDVACFRDSMALLSAANEKLQREIDAIQGVYVPGAVREHNPKLEIVTAMSEASAVCGLGACMEVARNAWARWSHTCWMALWREIHDVTWNAMRLLCYGSDKILLSAFHEAYEKARRLLTPTAEAQFRSTLAVYRRVLLVGRAAA